MALSSEDPLVILKTLIEENIELAKDDNKTVAKVLVEFEFPESKLKDFFKKYDVIVTVGPPEERDQWIGFGVKRTIGDYKVGVWCIDRPGVTGWKMRRKAVQDVRRILRENISGSGRFHKTTRNDDRLLASPKLYHTIQSVEYWTFS